MTAQEYEPSAPFPGDDLDDMPLNELVGLARSAVRALTRRLVSIHALGELSPVGLPNPPSGVDWGGMMPDDAHPEPVQSNSTRPEADFSAPVIALPFAPSARTGSGEAIDSTVHDADRQGLTLPALLLALENTARSIAAAQMSLARHTSEVLDVPADRSRLLGLPEGKTAFRDAADYLRTMLRVDRGEAQRRIRYADALSESRAMTGEKLPPQLPHLAVAVRNGELDRAAIDHVTTAVSHARLMASNAGVGAEAVDQLIDQGELLMVEQAQVMDPRSLRQLCNHWLRRFEAIVAPDGKEPTDLDSPQLQGLLYKGRKNGFHQWQVAANDAQHEVLRTIASAATNPRARNGVDSAEPSDSAEATRSAVEDCNNEDSMGHGHRGDVETPQLWEGAEAEDGNAEPPVDPRTNHQKQLDGLIACISGGLALAESTTLPWTGGMRPQVAVTIDYKTLLGDLTRVGAASLEDLAQFQSTAAFTGPVHPRNIRALACDADILPVVLGADGQILDVGRGQRLFPARLRQAIAARDGGCSAPGCDIPAPWCDVHHVDHWEHGGVTSTDNGVLLCNHHHHAIHAGAWEIDMRSGRPWFIPAPYLDPRQRPQRNRFWRR